MGLQTLSRSEDRGADSSGFVTGALLNKCPDPLREDLEVTVKMLNGRSAADRLMVQTDRVRDSQIVNNDFHDHFSITCTEVDRLIADLRQEHQLTPRLEALITGLRLQFKALIHYFFKADDIEVGDMDKCIAMLNEMRNGEKYKTRIFPNITLMRVTMEKAATFDQAKTVYDYMMNDKYSAQGGKKETVCKPDAKFFRLWSVVCVTPAHFKALYEAMKEHGMAKLAKNFGGYWITSCSTSKDFESFFDSAGVDKSVIPGCQFFMAWAGRVRSLDDLVLVIHGLFKSGVVPDNLLIERIAYIARTSSGNRDVFTRNLSEIYGDNSYGEFPFIPQMRNLYESLK